MKVWKNIITICCLLMLVLGYQSVDAQEDIAQEAYTILERNCFNCHGENGAHKDVLLIERTVLVNNMVVIPSDPESSEFYKRLLGPTENGAQMPLNLPPLSQEAIETIALWITAGAPDWDVQHADVNFITTDAMLDTMRTHLESLDPFDRPSARYFTLTQLYNAGESPQTLGDYRIALSKLINSLSWKFEITNPTPIDAEETIFHIDLRHYEWNIRTDVWSLIEQAYPYNIEFDPETQTGLIEKLTQLQTETGSTVPFVHVDWFLATASLPPLYHDILDLPQKDGILEAQLEVNVASNIRNAPGIDVWRAGFNDSGVSTNNRVVERHTSRYGAYWKSYDFAGSVGSQNIFTHPLDFTHDGGEIIFNLPNGLQAYYLVDANGNRLDDAPIDIVSNPAASDPTVRNGLSCIGCHTQGMKKFKDSVHAAIEQDQNPPYDKEQALRLYPEQSVLDDLLQKDTNRFLQALEKIGGPFEDNESRQRFFKKHESEPIQRFHEAFQAPLDASHAAAAVGLETSEFLTQIREKQSLKNLGLQTLIDENGTVKRDAWTSKFHDVISGLNTPDSVLPPVVQRPERIPGASVYIPDPNLRAAIEEALGKASGDTITAEDMTKLTRLDVRNSAEPRKENISNLTGLEFAINLNFLHIGGNSVSDLSPLAGLIKLDFLDAQGNLISDISPLKGLTRLKGLILTGNLISDISPLIGLTNLEELRANKNLISDFSPLTKLTTLKGVWISGESLSDLSLLAGLINLEGVNAWDTSIEDISPLAGLTKLRWLDFGRAPISDLAPLANITNLRKLTFYDCSIKDLSTLEGLTELIHIKMPHNTISDLSSLEKLTRLTYLELGHNAISDVSPLIGLTNLETLWIGNNEISDISALAGLTNLEELKLTDNPITDFSPLDELFENTKILFDVTIPDPNLRATIAEALGKDDAAIVPITLEEMATLTKLNAGNKEISDLTGLESAANLESLHLYHNAITDFSPLSALHNLVYLALDATGISDISPLADLRNLVYLHLTHNGISDISPLVGLRKLETLYLGINRISDLSPLQDLTELKRLSLWGNKVVDITPLASLNNLIYLGFPDNDIGDILPLAALQNLISLDLHDNKISDISAITSLDNLENLRLSRNNISDVSPLAALRKLKTLNLDLNNISDVSPLAALHKLKTLTLTHNQISDFSSVETLPALTSLTRANNPGAPAAGTKIEGPWLWVIVPGRWLGDTDFLAEASDGTATELKVATHGAKEGKAIGNSVWTSHTISATKSNNINEMTAELGWGRGQEIYDHIVYGSVTLYAPSEQQTHMFVGSDDGVKVWLNGELVYQDFLAHHGVDDYQNFFSITLKQGTNVLLVAADNRGYNAFSGYWGFAQGTEYTAIPPGVGFTLSATETSLLPGDTFTLNLNAENITDLAGWQTDITFDPNILEAVEVSEGDFLKAESGDTFFQGGTIDNTTGKITGLFAAQYSESGVSGTGTLLSVTFMAKTGGETQVTLENFEFGSSSGAVIPAVPPNITITVGEYPAWDVNQDGRVSVLDLILVAKDLGSDAAANLRTDVNRDGNINIQDLILVAQHIGESTDSAAPPIVAIDSNELTPAIVQEWIKQAQAEDDGSLAFRKGIENLQRLLTSLIPEKTALLANYPNPFNPETWIPYQLVKPADVTLTIYTADGAVVRTLALGHQAAGIYRSRSHAVYWDGRNKVGESVASGIYFYTLTAGDFTATRKMLILK